MKRYDGLRVIASAIKDELVVVSLGGITTEWHSLRPGGGSLYLQALGSVTPVAMGIALGVPSRKVISLDTDGSLLLNLGILATLANQKTRNLIVTVWDNECYECIGGPPTHTAGVVDLAAMAKGAGIRHSETVRTPEELRAAFQKALASQELYFIVVKIEAGTKEDIPSKRTREAEDTYLFVRHLEQLEGRSILT